MKVVGIGLNKTGTTTLGTCLRELGYNHSSWSRDLFQLWLQGKTDELLQTVDRFDSFEDFPWLLIYEEIDRQYPGSKFILTRRKDAPTWFRSICKHADWTGPHEVNESIYGHALPYEFEQEHIQFYEDYLKKVREYFRDRPNDMLEVCWEEGDGWMKLCDFLGFEVPATPFPHANKSPNLLVKLQYFLNKSSRKFVRRIMRRISR